MRMYKVLCNSPMIPSFDVKRTSDFFEFVLGFNPVFNTSEYAIYRKDNHSVHILPAGKEIGEMEFYLEVDDIERVWAQIKDAVEDMKVREPFNRDYGMREIHIEVPQTKTLMFIGQQMR